MQPADLYIGKRILDGYTSKLPISTEAPKRIGVAVRSWKDDTEYRESLANVLSRLQEQDNVEIIFIPMSHPEDTKEAKIIASYMPKGEPPLLSLKGRSPQRSKYLCRGM